MTKILLEKNEYLICTAGKNYFQIYPNGDIYRCMRYYGTGKPPISNISNFDKETIARIDNKCYEDECEVICDRDWAVKWIVSKKDGSVIKKILSGHLEKRFGEQNPYSPSDSMVKIFWAPTMVCNYSCEYCTCLQSKEKTKAKFRSSSEDLTADEWVRGFEKIKDSYEGGVITTNGGEPLLSLPCLIRVIKAIQDKFKFAVTTNLSFPMINFIRNINPKNVEFNLSLHPLDRKFNFDAFLNRALFLTKSGFPLKINYVGYPEQLYSYDFYEKLFSDLGIHIELIPWVNHNMAKNFNYSNEEADYLNKRAKFGARKTEDSIIEYDSEIAQKKFFDVSFPSNNSKLKLEFGEYKQGEMGPILYFMNKNNDPIFQIIMKSNIFISYHRFPDIWIDKDTGEECSQDLKIIILGDSLFINNTCIFLSKCIENINDCMKICNINYKLKYAEPNISFLTIDPEI